MEDNIEKQINLLNNIFSTTGYKIENNSLYKVNYKKNEIVTKKLCNFVPYAKSENILDDGVEQKRFLTLSGIHCTGKKLNDIIITSNEFNSMNWITSYWGLQCNIETGTVIKDCIRHAIQCTATNLESTHVYTHTGWREINGKLIFLCNDLYLDQDINTNIKLPGKLNRYSLLNVSQRNIDADLQYIKKLFDETFIPHKIIFPLLAFAFLSPLNHFFKMIGYEPKVILFLIGKTGARKSTLASLILSFFGDFTNTDLPISFRDTANSIIEQTFSLKDVLTVIDDYHPSTKMEEQSMNKTAQIIMRSYGDRIGKNRLDSCSNLKVSKPPRGNAILTGESAPDISESGTARYLLIELKKEDINIDKLSELQEIAKDGAFKAIMSLYIRYIYMTVNEPYLKKKFLNTLKDTFVNERTKLVDFLGNTVHGRIPEALAWLFTGFTYFLNFLKQYEILDNSEIYNYRIEFYEILINLAKQQINAVRDDNPSIKFISKLNSLIESKSVLILDKSSYQYAGGNNFIGFEDENYYYLIADIVHKEVKKLCNEQNELFTVSKKTLLKHLAEDGYIETSASGNTKELRLGNEVKRFLWLKKDKFKSAML